MMNNKSNELKKAMTEIEEVMRKYDIGGFVTLQDGLGNGEFKMFVDTPTWSMIRFLPKKNPSDGLAVHLKLYSKIKKIETNRTVNMVFNAQGVLGMMFLCIDEIKAKIQTQIEVVSGKGKFSFGDNEF